MATEVRPSPVPTPTPPTASKEPVGGDRPFGRGVLTELMPPEVVRNSLGPWHPYPTAGERSAWLALPAIVRADLVERADRARDEPWPSLPATLFADMDVTGRRQPYETPHFLRRQRLRDLVLGACLEDAYDEAVVDAVWSVCEESSWSVPAHQWDRQGARMKLPDVSDPEVDLFAAETAAQLAWALYLVGDRLDAFSPSVRRRVVSEIDRRVLTPFLARDDWRWMGVDRDHVNNWNPWVCSNVIMCALLTEDDDARRATIVSRAIAALDVYAHSMSDDGGCTEGQSYWAVGAARLFDALYILHEASGGRLDGLQLDRVRSSIHYPVAMHVDGRRMIQHSDGHGVWLVEAAILHRYGRVVGYPPACKLAVHLRDLPRPRGEHASVTFWRGLMELFEPGYQEAVPAGPPAPATAWFELTEVLTARQEQARAVGLLVAAKGGHNAEDHNQNDAGGFSVVLDGQHFVVDPGVEGYTAKTFSDQRYDIWTMNSDWHNLPVVNGVVQAQGRAYAAADTHCIGTDQDDRRVVFTSELASAWPEAAGLRSYRREITFDRDEESVVLVDTWDAAGVQSLVIPIVVAVEPQVSGHTIVLAAPTCALTIDVPGFSVEVESRDLSDAWMQATWGERLWRLVLTPKDLAHQGSMKITFSRAR